MTIPFTLADLGGIDPLAVNLTHYDVVRGRWVLAVSSNLGASPGHAGPAGDRIVSVWPEKITSQQLGDYGVHWNPLTNEGFAWATLDRSGEFAFGESLCDADIAPAPVTDGIVGVEDLIVLLQTWGTAGAGDMAPHGGDGIVDVLDLFELLRLWGECP